MQQVSLTTIVMGIEPSARARLNAVSILAVRPTLKFDLIAFAYSLRQIFIGQVMGTSVGTKIFVDDGWRPAAAFALGLSGLQLVILLMRGPHCDRHTWFGYQNGETRKSVAEENKLRREVGVQESVDEKLPTRNVDEEKGARL